MPAVSVLHAPSDGVMGARISEALARVGLKPRAVAADSDLAPLSDDAAIVVWSRAALQLSRLRDEAQAALERGSLVPVAIGDAPAPEGLAGMKPIDLTDWRGDDEDPRWRVVLDAVVGAAERRRRADQNRWIAAQAEAVERTRADREEHGVPGEAARPAPAPRARRPKRRFDPAAVAAGGIMMLCASTGAAIILAPTMTGGARDAGPSQPFATPSRTEPVDLAVLQAAATPIETATAAPPEAVEGANAIAAQKPSEDSLQTDQPVKLAALGPAAPVEDTEEINAASGPALTEDPAPETMDAILAGVPELQEPVQTAGQPEGPSGVFKDCSVCPDMRALKGGDFVMGAGPGEGKRPHEMPRKRATMETGFAIGVREVTFAEWDACVADGGCRGYRAPDFGWGRGKQPVTAVSYKDAAAYAAWLSDKTGHNYRLPREAEWEYAARAGAETAFSFGDGLSPRQANYDGRFAYRGNKSRALGRPTATGSYPANSFGLFDMHGNLWEWTADCWRSGAVGPADGACGTRTLKGGAFNTGGWRLRAAHRIGKPAAAREMEFGFRVVRDLE